MTEEPQVINFATAKGLMSTIEWPSSQTPLKHMSPMMDEDTLDITIYSRYTPKFWGIYVNGELIGVSSGHKTEDDVYRVRGIVVKAEYQGLGYGAKLLQAAIDEATGLACRMIWGLPKNTDSRSLLTSKGFVEVRGPITNEYIGNQPLTVYYHEKSL